MRSRVLSLVRHQSLGALALLVALTGTAYAAGLPRNSVGSPQITNGAVRSADVKDRSLLAKDFKPGQLPSGAPGKDGRDGQDGTPGPAALGFEKSVPFFQAQPLGSIGPWTLSGYCDSFNDAGYLTVTGPGDARVTRFTSTNDGAVSSAHNSYVLGRGARPEHHLPDRPGLRVHRHRGAGARAGARPGVIRTAEFGYWPVTDRVDLIVPDDFQEPLQ